MSQSRIEREAFATKLNEGRQQIADRRSALVAKTGHPVSRNRQEWLRQQVINSARTSSSG